MTELAPHRRDLSFTFSGLYMLFFLLAAVEPGASRVRAEGNDDLADALLEAAGLPIPEPPPEVVAPPAPVAPPELSGPPPQQVVDAVIYAAADAADLAPRKTRLALRAALLRAQQLGVTADVMVLALADG